ncbi:MAG: CFI-box-CTERM domain-containing protein, partial [Nitrosopumilaceae archaeon]
IGYTITEGSLYFETSASNADGNPQAIVTPEGIFVHKKTEFTVTVDDETTKMYVIDGEVVFIPFDTSRPQMVITPGNSIIISGDKVEETKLDTASVDKWWEVSAQESQQPKSGGCLIATATYGSELAPQVQFLREIRDNTVLSTASGASFMTSFNSFYYLFSPAVADLERQNPMFKETVKIAITPLLSSLSLLQYVDIDSDAEMLGYGIGIILLNIGMYFVAPTLIVFKIKNRKKEK